MSDWVIFPLANPQTTCGLRSDLPKKERVHHWVNLGPDIRNSGEEGFIELEISACSRCGKDSARKTKRDLT